MRKIATTLALAAVPMLLGSYFALAAQGQPMSFFVTSVGKGNGGNLGGLAGADAHCQRLAEAAGAGNKTWHAYLSTQARPGQPAVNARDRIGSGPWYNSKGAEVSKNLGELHGDTVEEARLGSNLFKQSALNEKGGVIPGVGDAGNMHNIMTGSQPDGRAFTDAADHTCNNWTSFGLGSAQVGHSDRIGNGNTSWNSAASTRACSQSAQIEAGGTGLFYCFAIN